MIFSFCLFHFKAILPQVPQGIDKSKNQNKIARCFSLWFKERGKIFIAQTKDECFPEFFQLTSVKQGFKILVSGFWSAGQHPESSIQNPESITFARSLKKITLLFIE